MADTILDNRYDVTTTPAVRLRFYEDGVFPALRVAHAVANHLPILSEECPEGWDFIPTVPFEELVDQAELMICGRSSTLSLLAETAFEAFRARPLVLPS